MYAGEDLCTCLRINVRESLGKYVLTLSTTIVEGRKARNALKHMEQVKVFLP